jgi:DNA-binding transcriptional ArsR family regulator
VSRLGRPRGSTASRTEIVADYQDGMSIKDMREKYGISQQAISWHLRKAGVATRRSLVTDEYIDSLIAEARSKKLFLRGAIVAYVRDKLLPSVTQYKRVSQRLNCVANVNASTRYIPFPDTPKGYRWCQQCNAFSEPSSRNGLCRTHLNAHMRQYIRNNWETIREQRKTKGPVNPMRVHTSTVEKAYQAKSLYEDGMSWREIKEQIQDNPGRLFPLIDFKPDRRSSRPSTLQKALEAKRLYEEGLSWKEITERVQADVGRLFPIIGFKPNRQKREGDTRVQ